METIVWVVHVVTAIVLVGLVLMQHGKGADMGAAFGTGSAGGVFGSAGSANFLSRTTAVAATMFFATSLSLTYISAHPTQEQGVMDRIGVENTAQKVAPAPVEVDLPGSKSREVPK